MAQSGSAVHAARNDRIASTLANANIICVPWVKNACASVFFEEMGRVYGPRAFGINPIGFLIISGSSPGLAADVGAGVGADAPGIWLACGVTVVCSCAAVAVEIVATIQRGNQTL